MTATSKKKEYVCELTGELFYSNGGPGTFIEQSSAYVGPPADSRRSKPSTKRKAFGVRKPITNFTARSQQNFMRQLSAWRPRARLVIATLTYPAVWPDVAIAARHRRAYEMRLRRRFPDAVACWRLEYQKRGAPHFHLVVDFCQTINLTVFRSWQASAWAQIVGEPARTNAEWIRSESGRYYLAKEIGKQLQSVVDGHSGRWWGWINKGSGEFVSRIVTLAPAVRAKLLDAVRTNYRELLEDRGQLVNRGGRLRWTRARNGCDYFNSARHLRSWLLYNSGPLALDRLFRVALQV